MALYSTLQTIGIEDNARRAIVVDNGSRAHGSAELVARRQDADFRSRGKLWTVPAEGGTPTLLNTGAASRCTGSHGLSPDGKWLAITCSMPDKPETRVYIVPSGGGEPRLVTENPDVLFP